MRGVPLERVEARAYTIPTDQPEADGTLLWTSTALVVVEVAGGGKVGIGYTYAHGSIVSLITGKLADAVKQQDALRPSAAWRAMQRAVRNLGREGLAATAISAIDTAIWDLKAQLLELPLVTLLGQRREAVPIYGSGGFTNYNDDRLGAQLSHWIERDGCRWVKMKVGSDPDGDPRRVSCARRAIGSAGLFVDANGAYGVKQALRLADSFAPHNVSWFEEPVSSDDLTGLRLLRRRAPACMDIAAGEYGYTIDYFRRMLTAEAVDVQQADVTRCGGFTGWLEAAALCDAHHVELSGHCAAPRSIAARGRAVKRCDRD